MSKVGPVIIIDDDRDDQEILVEAFRDIALPNELKFFENTDKAFDYLMVTSDRPFIIISDVNLPKENGIAFKQRIDDNPYLRQKSIPFVFLTTYVERRAVDKAYKELSIQGYFQKRDKYEELKKQLALITEYWAVCRHPNSE